MRGSILTSRIALNAKQGIITTNNANNEGIFRNILGKILEVCVDVFFICVGNLSVIILK